MKFILYLIVLQETLCLQHCNNFYNNYIILEINQTNYFRSSRIFFIVIYFFSTSVIIFYNTSIKWLHMNNFFLEEEKRFLEELYYKNKGNIFIKFMYCKKDKIYNDKIILKYLTHTITILLSK